MTSQATEIEELTSEQLRDNPRCCCRTCWKLLRRTGTRVCGKPSAVRVHVTCGACGYQDRVFLCRRHAWFFFRNIRIRCRACYAEGQVRTVPS